MRSIFFASVLTLSVNVAFAQNVRPMTDAELNRRLAVCGMFRAAMPAQITGYTTAFRDCKDIGWAEEKDGKYYVSVDEKGKLQSSYYVMDVTYNLQETKDNEQSEMEAQITQELTKGKSANRDLVATLGAKIHKVAASKKVTVFINGNVMPPQTVYYDKALKPQKISLPIPASYAMMYAVGDKMPLDENSFPVTSPIADVNGDMAIIVVGKKLATVKLEWDGQDRTKVETITFNDVAAAGHTAQGAPVPPDDIQNITVMIKGERSAIEQVIKGTDWKKLQSYIGK